MRLTKVFNCRDQFSKIDTDLLRTEVKALEQKLHSSTDGLSNIEDHSYFEKLQQITKLLEDIDNELPETREKFERKIKTLEQGYLKDSYDTYENRFSKDFPPDVAKYPPNATDPESIATIKSLIKYYVDWTFPGLEVGPGTGRWTRELVACDPLYIVDIHKSFLDKTIAQFSSQYQRRIRPYCTTGTDLSIIPQGQIGFVFAWEVFEYLPYDEIKQYLKSIYSVMRPGGVLMFSYNNCEQYGSCLLAEDKLRCYMTRSKMRDLTEGLGYSTIEYTDKEPSLSYAIVKKPGQLNHNRDGQTLATIKIKPKPPLNGHGNPIEGWQYKEDDNDH